MIYFAHVQMRLVTKMWRRLGMLCSACLLFFLCSHVVLAASTVSSLTSQPTSLVASASANQKFVFTLGTTWALGSTITLTFPSGFDLSSISEDDVDIFNGSTNISTQTNCAGSELASVGVSGQVMTLTICPLNGGNMLSGTVVTVLIGSNATGSGTGVHQIVNPTSVGTYYIDLGGTSGNLGSIPVPITTSSSSSSSGTVSASVPSSSPSASPSASVSASPEGGAAVVYPSSPSASPSAAPSTSTSPSVTTSPEAAIDSGSGASSGSSSSSSGSSTSGSSAQESGPTTSPSPSPDFSVELSAQDIPLSAATGSVGVVSDSQPIVTIDLQGTVDPAQVAAVYVVVGDTTYVLDSQGDGTYSVAIVAPTSQENIQGVVVLESGATFVKNVQLIPSVGEVYEIDRTTQIKVPVSGARVMVYTSGIAWNASAFSQENPIITGLAGTFSWYVPNGTYEVHATKDGYSEGVIQVRVDQNVLVGEIEIAKIVTTVSGAQAAFESGVQATEAVAVAVSAANVIALVGFGLLSFLRYVWSWFFFIIFGRKGRFGIVYHAITKEPLDLATVRLFRLRDHALVRTVVTNKRGEYFFTVDKNDSYRLDVAKEGFVFPSVYLKGIVDDGAFSNIYYGTPIAVQNEQERRIVVNVPMDPLDVGKLGEPWRIRLRRALQFGLWMLAPVGLVLAVFGFFVRPSWYTGGVLFFQILVLGLNVRLSRPRVERMHGLVRDGQTRETIAQATVRLFEPTYNKLIETVTTDAFGRYSFFLGPGTYYVTVEKDGYVAGKIERIDLTAQTGIREFGELIELSKQIKA